MTNIYGPVGAVTETVDVKELEVHTEEMKNGKKPYLQRTSTIITMAAGLVAILTGIWQFILKSEKAQQESQTAKEQVIQDSTASLVEQKAADQDTMIKTAGKNQ